MITTTVILSRDNAFTIGRAVDSATRLTDNVIVIDTGSQDSTIGIARALGAKVHRLDWKDSFAAARNAAFDLVPEGLIFYLDSDEWVSPGELEQACSILRSLDEKDRCWAPIIIDDTTGRHALHVPRIVSAESDLRYRYRVHERLCRGDVEAVPEQVQISVLHDGYTEEALTNFDKQSRNLHLLELSLCELPQDPHLLFFKLRDGLGTRSVEDNRALVAQIEESCKSAPDGAVRDFTTLARKVVLTYEWFLRGAHQDTVALARQVLQAVPSDADAIYAVSVSRLIQAQSQIYESLVWLARSRQKSEEHLTWSMSETPVHLDALIGEHLRMLGDRRHEKFMLEVSPEWNDWYFEGSVFGGKT